MQLNKANSKMITVRNRGFVTTSRGRVMGPIRTPYREAIDRIWFMLNSERADIWELLDNGEYLKLTPQNYDTDNNQPVTTPPIPNLPPLNEVGEVQKTVETPAASPVTAPNQVPETPVVEDSVETDNTIERDIEDSVSELKETEEAEYTGDDEDDAEEVSNPNNSGKKSGKRNRKKKKNSGYENPQTTVTQEETKAENASLEVPVDEA